MTLKTTMYPVIVLSVAACGFCMDLGPNTQVEVGAGAWYFQYKEPGYMKDKGAFAGIQGAYTYRGPLTAGLQDCMISAEARAGWGHVDYDGHYMDANHTPVSFSGSQDVLIEGRGLMGYDLGGRPLRLTPFLGFGYRYLNDDLSPVTPAGYDRVANYLYSPLGLQGLVRLNESWQIGGSAEYDLFWFGRQKTLWGDWIHNDQHDGYGVRGSLRLVRESRKSNVIVEPYVIYWDIKASEVSDGVYEPQNRSLEAGLRVSLEFQ
jgi:hypothetical protein